MAWSIYPSQAPVGTHNNWGSEDKLTNWMKLRGASILTTFVSTQMTCVSSSGLVLAVGAGTVVIDGYVVTSDASGTVTLADTNTNFVYCRLTTSGGFVTGAEFIANVTGAVVASAVCLATVVCSGGAIGTIVHSQANPSTVVGTYTGDDVDGRTIHLGFAPKVVEIVCSTTNSPATYISDNSHLGQHVGSSPYAASGITLTNFGFYVERELNYNTNVYRYVATV
jgi:hypothetical protein